MGRQKGKIRSLQGAYKDLMAAPETETKSAEWILEYVLRHCNNDWVISELLRILPFPNENLRLKKMILLKKISSDVSKGSISEKTLETLHSLKELNRQLCTNYEKNVQELCCKVAVECTLKHLRNGKIDWESYNEALKKLWSDCVEDTEDVEMDGPLSVRVIEIKRDLVAVASNHMLRDTLLQNYKKEDVLESLCAFLKDAWDETGPTFLETVAEDVVHGRYNPSGKGANHVMHSGRMAVPSCETRSADAGRLQEAGTHVDVRSQETGILDGVTLQETRSSDVADKIAENIEDIAPTFPPPWADFHVDDQGRSRSEGIRIPNSKVLPTPEFVKITGDLRQSTIELHSRVDDPLPDALNFAEEHVARRKDFPSIVDLDGNKSVENPSDEIDKNVLPESDKGRDNQVQQMEEKRSKHNQSDKGHSESLKFNIMDRNPTACTFQWDEDTISSPEEENSASASRKVRLPSPSGRHCSPLKRPRTIDDITCRRRHTKWTTIEEETLKNEVLKYGKGRWKFILEKNRHIFEERTEVDLKDKWRNIARREGLHVP